MLTPIAAPLPCFGLSQDASDPQCQACPHFDGCRQVMGMRAGRVTLDRLKFDLIPKKLPKSHVAPEDNLDAIYQATYRMVYGSNPGHTLGVWFTERMRPIARQAKVTLPQYILINMVGYQLAWPDKEFTPGCLVDNRALARVNTYAKACRERYGSLDLTSLDMLTKQDNARFDLRTRMSDTEFTVGCWIINWKLDNEGPPYTPLFDALELELDVNWLAIEPRFKDRLEQYLGKLSATANSHDIAATVRKLKKHGHEAYANFAARQLAMPEAVERVVSEFGFTPQDFERPNDPVTDPLLFWHRLALAMQHLECLKFVELGTGYYARRNS